MIAWAGRPDRECGEHRTTIDRAWCFECTEWCYPQGPCARCELPMLRAELSRALAALAATGVQVPRVSANKEG